MTLRFLSDDQAHKLRKHLMTHLNSEDAAWLVQEIDELFGLTSSMKGPGVAWMYHALLRGQRGFGYRHEKLRGRPKKKDRDELIRWLSDFYPERFSRKYRGGYFAKTVQMVICFTGTYLEDPVDAIIDALRGREILNVRSRGIQRRRNSLNTVT